MKVEDVKKVLEGGKICTVTFIKRTTGEKRVMNCRTEVKKGVKGVGQSFVPEEKGLITVFDMQKRQFRMISCESIIDIHAHGEVIKPDEQQE